MKSSKIRLQNKRKYSAKNCKPQKTQDRFEVTPITIGLDSHPPTPDSEKELQSIYENEIVSQETELKDAETVDEISQFIRELGSDGSNGSDEQAQEYDEIDETMMQVTAVSTLPQVDENKKGKRQTVLEVKVENLEKKLDILGYGLKEVKDLLKIRARTSKNTGQIAAYCKKACVFPLLPKFQLKKVSQVENMELDIHANPEYKEQLVTDKN